MRFSDLEAWLNWQSTLNPAEIDLGLERIADVLKKMGHGTQFDCPLIMVAGTNGKGSVVAFLEALARAHNLNVCTYTSPHILRYNERIKINGIPVDDETLCRSFEAIDRVRDGIALTYFEFGTLAAINVFKHQQTDLIVMEVGLGGRLDAVNVMEPDISIITPIAIDHSNWLGDTREAIAREKAGILRHDKPAICGDPDPPLSLSTIAEEMNTPLYRLGQAYAVKHGEHPHWNFSSELGDYNDLSLPALSGEFQLDNAATALMALSVLIQNKVIACDLAQETINKALTQVHLDGRYQVMQEAPLVIADVAHNVHAVEALVAQLKASPVAGSTHVVIAMLADKPVEEVVQLLSDITDRWYTAGLESEHRGLSALDMKAAVASSGTSVKLSAGALCESATVKQALALALANAEPQDRIVVVGSFYTVAAATEFFLNR